VAGGDELLVAPENLAEAAFGAGALHGVADGGVGGHDGEARDFGRDFGRGAWRGAVRAGGCGGGGVSGGAFAMPESKAAAFVAAAVFTQIAEIALPPDVLLGAETHDDR